MNQSEDRITDVFIVSIILCIVLGKIFGVINWSWWVILAPIWVPFLLGIALLIGVMIYLVILFIIKKDWRKNV
jgi:membrane protein YdbS with pleckstrin-like domain